jgi:tripartite-type tricarboxylate transporter receptor subunit TctC
MTSPLTRRHWLAWSAAALAGPGWCQASYPHKPINLTVPFAAGGTTDILGRLMARHLGERLGVTVVVDNKPGAGGSLGTGLVAKAPADGYSLLMGTIGTHTINPFLYKKLSYDAFKDFAPVSLVALVPNVLVVHPSIPVRAVRGFIAFAKENPGKLSYGSAGNGTSIHLSGALFEQLAQVTMTHVPYRGSAPAITDLLAGQISCMFDNLPSALPHIKSGALRALAVTSTTRTSALPSLPTIAESVAGYDATSWFGLWAPAGTPAAVIQKLSGEVQAILQNSEVKQGLQEQGAEAAPDTPAHFAAFIQTEATKWSAVVKAANIQVD